MEFGVNILNFGPGARPEAFMEWARRSEDLGFHSVMISDHVAVTPNVTQRYPEPFYDSLTVLSWLASATSRIRLGTTVIVLPYHNPIHLARQVANIDHLSGGRFILGVGVGNAEDEFEALNVPFRHRGAYSNEEIEIILKLWTSEGLVSYDGRLLEFKDVYAIEPRQQPHPPLWVGGSQDGALKRTAQYADGFHPIVHSMSDLRDNLMPKLRSYAAARSRPVPALCPRVRMDVQDNPVEGDRLPGEGSLDQIRSDLAALEQLGAEHILLDWYTGDLEKTKDHEHGWRMLSQMASEVLDLSAGRLRS